MTEDAESQFRAAVGALDHWVKSAPIPHSSKEWRERYLKLDEAVRRLSVRWTGSVMKGPKEQQTGPKALDDRG
jgi:hypothetical protein